VAATSLLELGPTPNVVLGDVGGRPVTTVLSMEAGPGSAGVFNVATPPAYRGHGYGAAATARAVAASFTCGATWAWLQSSSAGHRTYQRLGFRDVELWPCWVSSES
jgi:predicted GNAT family acetyltransferase